MVYHDSHNNHHVSIYIYNYIFSQYHKPSQQRWYVIGYLRKIGWCGSKKRWGSTGVMSVGFLLSYLYFDLPKKTAVRLVTLTNLAVQICPGKRTHVWGWTWKMVETISQIMIITQWTWNPQNGWLNGENPVTSKSKSSIVVSAHPHHLQNWVITKDANGPQTTLARPECTCRLCWVSRSCLHTRLFH